MARYKNKVHRYQKAREGNTAENEALFHSRESAETFADNMFGCIGDALRVLYALGLVTEKINIEDHLRHEVVEIPDKSQLITRK